MSKPLAVIVCGGRDFNDRKAVFSALNKLHTDIGIEYVITGRCQGADVIGECWAKAISSATVAPVPAPWKRLGKPAGPRRNNAMLGMLAAYTDHLGCVPMVVAFPGGKGTAGMVAVALHHGVAVWEPHLGPHPWTGR